MRAVAILLLLVHECRAPTSGGSSAGPPNNGLAAPVDFRAFEALWPRWLSSFKSGPGVGEYSYIPNHPTSVYGAADTLMSLHVLGLLGNLTAGQADEWAATVNAFQDPATGLYLAQAFEPHHQNHAGPPVLHYHDHEHTTAFVSTQGARYVPGS